MIKKYKLIIIILILISSISLCTSNHSINNIKRITAMEKLTMANNIAQNWNNTSTIFQVASNDAISNDGKAQSWVYLYQNNPDNKSLTKNIDVTCFSNGLSSTIEREIPTITNSISNWTIDSDSAVRIAKSDNHIKSFLSNYPNARIELISFVSEYSRTNGCIINIKWNYYNTSPNPITVSMDGNTGRILEVRE